MRIWGEEMYLIVMKCHNAINNGLHIILIIRWFIIIVLFYFKHILTQFLLL